MDFDARYYEYQAEQDARVSAEALVPVFSKAARYYRALLGPHLPAPTGANVLDVACGRGNFLYFLRDVGFTKSVGIDTNTTRVSLAQQLGLNARTGDALEWLEEHPDSYDLISALDFLEHLPKGAALRFLALANDALRPGGRLLLRTPCADGPFGASSRYNDFTHHQAFTSGLLRELLSMTRFDGIVVFGETPQPIGIANTLRSMAFSIAKPVAALGLATLGLGSPAIWSRDMWAVGIRPAKAARRERDA